MPGLLVVISGPSGAGKTTLIRELLRGDPRLRFSVSATTRAPRPGERDGVDYRFRTREEFERGMAAGEYLEHAVVHGELYGTPHRSIEEARAAGLDVVLDIDVQGAATLRAKRVEAVYVFVEPPSREALRARLLGRGTEDPAAAARRLRRAEEELRDAPLFPHRVVNDAVPAALARLRAIVEEERRKEAP